MKVGFVGLGDIGEPMASRLQDSGLPLTLWNRTANKAKGLLAGGASWAESPAALMQQVQIVGLCLSTHDAVRSICEGPQGLWAGAEGSDHCQVIIDFSTGSPQAAQRLAAQAEARGISWIDAPVSGGAGAARQGRLTAFAGGETKAVRAAEPVLKALASTYTHTGPSGSGQAYKLCNQLIVACNVAAIAAAVALARNAGLDARSLADVLRGGFADSAPLQVFGPRMAARHSQPRLGSLGLMLKDVGLVAELAAITRTAAPLLDRVKAIYSEACEHETVGPDADLARLIDMLEVQE